MRFDSGWTPVIEYRKTHRLYSPTLINAPEQLTTAKFNTPTTRLYTRFTLDEQTMQEVQSERDRSLADRGFKYFYDDNNAVCGNFLEEHYARL